MNERKMAKYMAVVIVVLTVLTVFSVMSVAAPEKVATPVNSGTHETPEVNSEMTKIVKELTTGPKISPTLEKELKNDLNGEKRWVYVVIRDPNVKSSEVPGGGIKIALRYLSPEEIAKMAKQPNVLKIYNKPTAHTQVEPAQREAWLDGKIGNVMNPLNFKNRGIYQTIHHGAQDAWMKGFTGSSTTIAIVDTGVDFAQPNLYGAWAVEENSSSPYYGWPIVYDSWSMALYLEANVTGIDAYYSFGAPSWYVNTSYNTTELSNGTVEYNGHYYNVKGIVSKSGHFHLGLLPETYNYLQYFNEVPAVLLVDSTQPYVYDTVYVDLNLNYDFTDEKPTNKSSPVSYRDDYNATSGNYSKMWNGGDGYPDWSGGMIYFIANGHDVLPGSDMFTWWNGVPNKVPTNGNLVAFVGDFDDYPHGTACAANAASRGTTINGLGVGMAPQAKIIAEPHFWFDGITEWLFSEIGYDFNFNSSTYTVTGFYDGDDAQISSNSWGSSFVHWDGWDTQQDRAMDYISYVFPQVWGGVYPVTSFLVALGNGGPGYGTATSPAVQHAISVGAGSEWGYRQILYGDSNLYDSYYGDVVDFSARGPFANGKTTPDILSTGEFGITPMALNYYSPYGGVGNGAQHFDLFAGTSMATPVTAGGLALIYDAYYHVYGQYPYQWTAKQLLMNSADDHNYDPLSQGPGWMNITRAVEIITGAGGITFLPTHLNAGTYNGSTYSMFPGIMYPGQSLSYLIPIKNTAWNSSASTTVSISSAIYEMKYEKNITVHIPAGMTDVSQWINLSNLSPSIPADTDLMQIMAYTDYKNLDDVNDTYHQSPNINYVLGYLWDYINYTSPTNYSDRMRMQVSAGQGNSIDVMFHDPMRRVHGDMWYQLRVIKKNSSAMDFHIKVVGYKAVNWNWISLSASSVAISGNNATAMVTATVAVPSNAEPGVYEGKILLNDGEHVSAIPVVVYVAAQINSSTDVLTFGGGSLTKYNTYLYENSHVRGLYDWNWRAEAGDWRFFFFNVSKNVDISNTYVTVDISWESNMTDIDGFILGNITDSFSAYYPSVYGPYTLHVTGQSKDTYITGGKYAWQTSSGGPREVISAPLQNGLMEIMLHNVLYAGLNASEQFTVKVYMATYSPQSPLSTVGDVSGLNATQQVKFTLGEATTKLDTNIGPLVYMDFTPNIPISTGEDKYYVFQTTGWKYLAVHVVSIDPTTDDIDLYMFYSDDGVHFYYYARSATSSGDEFVEVSNPSAHKYWLADVNGYDVAPGCTFNMTVYEGLPSFPAVSLWNLPTNIAAGTQYTFDMALNFTGYHVPTGMYYVQVKFGPQGSGGVYDVSWSIFAFDQVNPALVPETPNGTVNTAQPEIKVKWNDQGAVYSPAPSNYTVYIDGIMVPQYRTEFANGYIIAHVPFLLGEGMHYVKVYATDYGGNMNYTSWNFMVDTIPPALDITSPTNVGMAESATITITGTTDPGATVTVNGVAVSVASDGSFSYTATLNDGFNVFIVKATDAAGNSAEVRITALYLPELKELWANITNIYSEIGNLSSEISSLQSSVSSLQSQVTELSNQLSALKQAMDENVSMLEKAMKENRTEMIKMINDNVTQINDEITALKNKADAIKSEMEDVNAKQDNAISTNELIGIAGIALAIVAIIIALVSMMRKGKPGVPAASSEPETEEVNLDEETDEEDFEEI